jgi:hypothetical protein
MQQCCHRTVVHSIRKNALNAFERNCGASAVSARVNSAISNSALGLWAVASRLKSAGRFGNAFMQMQNTFAGIKPYCDVCNPITQTMRLLTPETTRPVHIFLPTRIVATTVRKQDR